MGRKWGLYPHMKQVQVNDWMVMNLKSFAEYLDVSEPEVIRRALDLYFRVEGKRLAEARQKDRDGVTDA